jgi:AcrR family transcriptional regulator
MSITTTNTKHAGHRSSAEVEAAILDAARDLLADGGVAGLSMRHIADRVGVSATAIYHYFDGKQEIVSRVVMRAFERFGAHLKEAMASHPAGSVERLHALGEAYFRVIFSIQPKAYVGQAEIPEGGGYNLLREAVSEAIAAGTIRHPEAVARASGVSDTLTAQHADIISMYLWCLAHGLVTLTLCGAGDRCTCEGKADPVRLLRAFAPFLDYGIRVPAGQIADNSNDEERCHCE